MIILGLGGWEMSKHHPPTKVCINILRQTESNGKFRILLEGEGVSILTLRKSSKETAPTTKLTGLRNYPLRKLLGNRSTVEQILTVWVFQARSFPYSSPTGFFIVKVSITDTRCLREMTGVKSQCWFIFSEVSVHSQLAEPPCKKCMTETVSLGRWQVGRESKARSKDKLCP